MRFFQPLTAVLLAITIACILGCGTPQGKAEKIGNEAAKKGQCSTGDCENGKGTFVYTNGDTFVGLWKNGKRNGEGTYTWSKGDKYSGNYADDMRSGQGTFTQADGAKYVGQWKSSMKDGQATVTYPDGGKYIGQYMNDMRNGQGTFTFADKKKYTGQWKNGLYEGEGTLIFPDKMKYVGQFRYGKFNGQGALYNKDGTVDRKGNWKNNEYVKVKGSGEILGGKEIVKNGSGDRSMGIMGTLYRATLWVTAGLKGANGNAIIEANEPMKILIELKSRIMTREMFVRAMSEVFVKSAASGYPTNKDRAFLNLFNSVEFSSGDQFSIVYANGMVTVEYLYKSGTSTMLGSIAGLDLKKALMAIWIGPYAPEESLRNDLLSGR